MANELLTYGDQAIVRSVQKEIEILTATENMLLTGLRKSTAKAMIHSWQDDVLSTPGSAAATEYRAFTPQALTTPILRTNVVEHVYRAGAVTDAQQKVTHESGENELVRQERKVMMDWANSAEFDLLRSTLTSGASGLVPKMNGVIATISTNATTHTSGTVFSESILNALVELTWQNGNGDVATDILVGSKMKRRISQFSGGITKNVEASARRSGSVVDMYETDFGTLSVHLHRYMQQSTDGTARVLGMRMDKYYIAYLQGGEAELTEQGKRATSTDFAISGYLTLENRNEKCSFFANGFLLAA